MQTSGNMSIRFGEAGGGESKRCQCASEFSEQGLPMLSGGSLTGSGERRVSQESKRIAKDPGKF